MISAVVVGDEKYGNNVVGDVWLILGIL